MAEINQITINSTSQSGLLKEIQAGLKKKGKMFIATLNPEIVYEASRNKNLEIALRKATHKVVDGVGLAWAINFLSGETTELIKGRELMEKIFELCDENNSKVFLLGSTDEVLDLSVRKIEKLYHNISVRAKTGGKFDKEGKAAGEKALNQEKEAIGEINEFKPDVLLVALGAPKQEIWLSEHLDDLGVNVAMVVGGSLDVFSGKLSKPPRWMSKWGIEWLWRLIQEPRRIKRIVTAVILFPLWVVSLKLRGKS
jgi:N-acetylglucosaminyldiphosphoundecaprenol N-acetyl-beta-D-mannosaminyltransferase